MARFGTPQNSPASTPGSAGLHASLQGATLPVGVHSLSGMEPRHRPEPIRAARGVTVGIVLSLPVWVGAAALIWATL